jgi:Flp pilus assembly protein protease CpaA
MSFPRVGFQSAAWSATATVSGFGFYIDVVTVRVSRAFVVYLFGGLGSGDVQQEIRLVRRAVARA